MAEQSASTSGDNAFIIQIQGDGNAVYTGNKPCLSLTLFDNIKSTRSNDKEKQDFHLLRPYAENAIDLIGREDPFKFFDDWLGTETAVSVHGMVGGAGRGKTRLALELCRHANKNGWKAGFLKTEALNSFRRHHATGSWAWDEDILIIVDYAALNAPALRKWFEELSDNPQANSTGKKLRFLLLERQFNAAVGWWATLFKDGDATDEAVLNFAAQDHPVALPRVDAVTHGRAIITETVKALGSDLKIPAIGDDTDFDRLLEAQAASGWGGEPLFLMMATFLAAQSGIHMAFALSRTDLAKRLAKRELARIEKMAANLGGADNSPFSLHMAAAITLLGGLDRDAGLDLIAREKTATQRTEAASPAAIFDMFREALPGELGAICPILPDIIGEAALLEVWGADMGKTHKADVLRLCQENPETAAGSIIRTCQDFTAIAPDEITGQDDTRIAALEWLEGNLDLFRNDIGALIKIADILPDRSLALTEFSLKITTFLVNTLRLAALVKPTSGVIKMLATYLSNLSYRLSAVGSHNDALKAAQESVQLCRQLNSPPSEASSSDLAGSLNALSTHYYALGKNEEALVAIRKAVEINRSLVTKKPEIYSKHLSSTLNNLSNYSSSNGQHEEALEIAQETVDLNRSLNIQTTEYSTHELAASLCNLANRHGTLKNFGKAVEAAQEGATRFRRLYTQRPDAYLPSLARCLIILAQNLSSMNLQDEALEITQEAVKLWSVIAMNNPDTPMEGLAKSLRAKSLCHAKLKEHQAALEPMRRAIEIFRELASTRPTDFDLILAISLVNITTIYNDLERKNERHEPLNEAAIIYQRLHEKDPAVFSPLYARCLYDLTCILNDSGRVEEALAVAEKTVDVRDILASEKPDIYTPDLAISLHFLGSLQRELGDYEAAFTAFYLALQKLKPYYLRTPLQHGELFQQLYSALIELMNEESKSEIEIITTFQKLGINLKLENSP